MNLQKLNYWKKVFEVFAQEDGKITVTQLESLIRSLGYNPTLVEIEDMINDLKGSQKIDFSSFSFILYRHSRYSKPEEELERSFSIFDKENKGTLNPSVVYSIFKNSRHPFTEDQTEKIIAKARKENDEIEIKSLVKILLNL